MKKVLQSQLQHLGPISSHFHHAPVSSSQHDDSHDSDSFRYDTKLDDPQSFRVCALPPGAQKDKIVLEFRRIDLGKIDNYHVLVSPLSLNSVTIPTICDGDHVQIDQTVASVLRRIRSQEGTSVIWEEGALSDGSCYERNQQTQTVINLVNLLFAAAINAQYPKKTVQQASLGYYWSGTKEETGWPPYDSPEWDALQDFFRSEYFSTMQAFQALVVSSTSPQFMVGKYLLPWERVTSAANFWNESGLLSTRVKGGLSFHMLMMDKFRTTSRHERKKLKLLRLLRATKQFSSIDPHDQDFALDGVASDIYDWKGKELFELDYSTSPGTFYHQLAVATMKQRRDLHTLSYVRNEPAKNVGGFPSWVPDWTSMEDSMDPLDMSVALFRSSHGKPSFSSGNRVLTASGSLVEEIKWVSEPFDDAKFHLYPEFRDPGTFRSLWENHPSGEPLIADFGSHDGQKPAEREYYIHFLQFWWEARLQDLETEEYMLAHPTRTSVEDAMARRAAQKSNLNSPYNFCNPDQLAAIKRIAGKSLGGIQCIDPTIADSKDKSII
ncbi:hypothetical protein G7Y89_g13740 [Cudoniella acicularis]|uniref:Uncharacterized protein n=1 Tax=Cudoniella acicularis TaxID=354080 RepID=A0A8H4VVR3_9HELO|nr:hypothetical protein G7Y89_g13740 [Cudoniella acicularis]